MIRASDPVTMAEVVVVTGRTEAEVLGCASGALAPDGDQMPLRRVLGVVLLVQFGATGALAPADALAAAVTASNGAADDGARSLLLGWEGLRPFLRWTEAGGASPLLHGDLHIPLVLIPVDQMLFDLGEAVAAVRDHKRRALH